MPLPRGYSMLAQPHGKEGSRPTCQITQKKPQIEAASVRRVVNNHWSIPAIEKLKDNKSLLDGLSVGKTGR
jgi:hypothetical protein